MWLVINENDSKWLLKHEVKSAGSAGTGQAAPQVAPRTPPLFLPHQSSSPQPVPTTVLNTVWGLSS